MVGVEETLTAYGEGGVQKRNAFPHNLTIRGPFAGDWRREIVGELGPIGALRTLSNAAWTLDRTANVLRSPYGTSG